MTPFVATELAQHIFRIAWCHKVITRSDGDISIYKVMWHSQFHKKIYKASATTICLKILHYIAAIYHFNIRLMWHSQFHKKNLKASATAISEIVHLKLQLYLPGATKLIHLLSLFYIFSYIFFVSLSICASFKLTWWATLHQHGATCRPQYFAKVQDNILEKHVSQTCTLLYSWASPGDGGMRSLQIMLRCQVWGKCPGMSRHIAKALD